MDRRRFLQSSSAALAGTALLGPTATRALAAARAAGVPDRLGIQLYTLRAVFPGDFNGVLEALARMGYGEVEFAGYHDRPPAVVRGVLDAVGLAAPSVHTLLAPLRADVDGLVESAATVGHRYLTVAWLTPAERPDRDGYLRLADELNAFGERTRAAGITMAYHNHDFEFETFGGGPPAYDSFVERLDPALVALEMDLYWVVKAGHDPVAYFERYPGRFPLWHVKDMDASGAFADVGAGTMDFARLFAASETAGLRHAFVEHDEPADPLATARAGIAHLRRLRG